LLSLKLFKNNGSKGIMIKKLTNINTKIIKILNNKMLKLLLKFFLNTLTYKLLSNNLIFSFFNLISIKSPIFKLLEIT
jgi:hypothetical protein